MEEFSPRVDSIDGVPVVWAALEDRGTATLSFTVGARDETPRTAGVAHLVEHLVMRRVGRVVAPHNASTDADAMRFFVTGSDAEIVDFVSRVCASIAALDSWSEDDVIAERQTIAAEVARDGGGVAMSPLTYRYGLADVGLSSFGAPAQHTLSLETARDFARRYLHAGNAAFTLTSRPPADLRLALPQGERRAPRRRPDDSTQRPTLAVTDGGGVTLSFETRAKPPISALATATLSTSAFRLLRTERSLVYSADIAGFFLDDDVSIDLLLLDPSPAHQADAVTAAVDLLRSVAADGPSEADLAHARETLVAHAQLRENLGGWLDMRAGAEARGRGAEVPTLEEFLASVRAASADDVRRALSAAPETLLVTIDTPDTPDEVVEKLGLTLWTRPEFAHAVGARNLFRQVMANEAEILSPRFGRGLRGAQLYVSDRALAWIHADGSLEMPLADIVLAGRSPRGVVSLAQRDGTSMIIDPADWRDRKGWLPRAFGAIAPDVWFDTQD